MKNILILSAILTGIAGCSSSDSSAPANPSGTVTAAQLVGAWASSCIVETPTSYNFLVTLTTTSGAVDGASYSDTTCTTVSQVFNESFDYTLGADITLDGSVAGITTGTEMDTTNTTTGAVDFGVTTYDSIALVGNLLYIGDDSADPLKDGTTADKRPTTLDASPLTKL